jgi:hypothetical protein
MELTKKDILIEVTGVDGCTVLLPKRAILSQPGTLLAEILKNDETATTIKFQLERVLLELISSFFNSPDSPIDLISLYESYFRKTMDYMGVPQSNVNNAVLKLATHLVSSTNPHQCFQKQTPR